jgi:hypothetical protein
MSRHLDNHGSSRLEPPRLADRSCFCEEIYYGCQKCVYQMLRSAATFQDILGVRRMKDGQGIKEERYSPNDSRTVTLRPHPSIRSVCTAAGRSCPSSSLNNGADGTQELYRLRRGPSSASCVSSFPFSPSSVVPISVGVSGRGASVAPAEPGFADNKGWTGVEFRAWTKYSALFLSIFISDKSMYRNDRACALVPTHHGIRRSGQERNKRVDL